MCTLIGAAGQVSEAHGGNDHRVGSTERDRLQRTGACGRFRVGKIQVCGFGRLQVMFYLAWVRHTPGQGGIDVIRTALSVHIIVAGLLRPLGRTPKGSSLESRSAFRAGRIVCHRMQANSSVGQWRPRSRGAMQRRVRVAHCVASQIGHLSIEQPGVLRTGFLLIPICDRDVRQSRYASNLSPAARRSPRGSPVCRHVLLFAS